MNAFLSDISAAAAPAIVSLLGTVLTIAFARAAQVAKVRWGIEIEARHREALQSALMSGIRAALLRGLTGKDAVQAAIQHAGTSVPDAIKALKPASGVLVSIAEAKLRDATAPVGALIDQIKDRFPGAAR